MANPFTLRHITEPEKFIGRKPLLRRIFTALDTTHSAELQSVSVVGPHSMGRTSLLHQLTQPTILHHYLSQPERYLFVYIDLKRANFNRESSLLKGIIAALADGLPDHSRLKEILERVAQQTDFDLVKFEETIHLFANPSLLNPPRYPIICLDEFQKLTDYPELFPKHIYDSWRSLMSNNALGFVIASERPLLSLAHDQKLTSDFFNVFAEFITLTPLTPEEARIVIEQGRYCDRPFSEQTCRKALSLTDTHPRKLQKMGQLIYHKLAHPPLNWLTIEEEFRQWEANIFPVIPPPAPPTIEGIPSYPWPFKLPYWFGFTIQTWFGRDTSNRDQNFVLGATGLLVILVGLVLTWWYIISLSQWMTWIQSAIELLSGG